MRFLLCLCLALLFTSTSFAQPFEAVLGDQGVTIQRNGKLLTQYLIDSGTKPVLYPVIGPGNTPMTRRFPIESKGEHERDDHPHHRSFWFTHGKVNGVDFWLEKEGEGGKIVHQAFEKIEGGETATIVTINKWIGPDGNEICRDRRTLTFGEDHGMQYIDFDVTVFADAEPVTFGDTKEGSFGVRVPGTMKVDAKMGGVIVNEHGEKDKSAWGKRSAWVDYVGPVEDKTLGIAILNHPDSYGFPTYWHVRTYGLFAANPFGVHDFVGKEAKRGDHTIEPGKSMTLRYRVLLHEGDTEQAKIKEAFARYSKSGN